MFVLTLTQRAADASRPDPDTDREVCRRLSALSTRAPFQPSGPGIVRGLTEDPQAAVDAAMTGLRDSTYAVGIGVGDVFLTRVDQPDGRVAVTAEGPGMGFGHDAAQHLRSTDRVAVRVSAADPGAAAQAEAVLRLVGHIVSARSAAEWRVLDLMVPGTRGQQKAVAQQLGITPQAVSKAVVRSLWNEEWQARPAAATLLRLCESAGPLEA
ncbi:hypothetical protein [Kocuria tytonis]|uniref:MarR family transcriptional regulator n=1 Tax=Kocuria tytonis TaxID=2054280 RepID=A0A495A2J8_9MICC|nr:hypothetical protein [Kocuria tytonis]RKQ33679.1 hypothetical protein C1C97_010690 [Kocuria tytonis]